MRVYLASSRYLRVTLLAVVATVFVAPAARADAVTDWNTTAGATVGAAGLTTPEANRVMAIAHTAAYDAANAISRRYPVTGTRLTAPADASIPAAIAAAHRDVLSRLVPSQQAAVDQAYRAALKTFGDDAATRSGVAVGEGAAAAVLSRRATDGAAAPETYRPHAAAGAYVPTTLPIALQWPQRTPWLMSDPAQFRPGPPPALTSEVWARDYQEVATIGAIRSSVRTAEQTAVARFWAATLPSIYHGLVRCVAAMPARDLTRNARLYMAVTQATDDAMIAVFDAKYHYAFWRPVTAIRNGDRDGNDATTRDPSWLPLLDTPMHPEYPCAHCIVAAAVTTVLKAEVGDGPQPTWTTSSATANGAARSWPDLDAFVQEVADARVYAGVHYRYSTTIAADMGRQVGALAVARYSVEPDRRVARNCPERGTTRKSGQRLAGLPHPVCESHVNRQANQDDDQQVIAVRHSGGGTGM